MTIYPGANRIQSMFALAHKPGSLYSVMSKISSSASTSTSWKAGRSRAANLNLCFISIWRPPSGRLKRLSFCATSRRVRNNLFSWAVTAKSEEGSKGT